MSLLKLFFAPVVTVLLWQSFAASSLAALTPKNLECEYHVNPLGIDALPPRLTWQLQSDDRDQHQTAYEILVAGDEKSLQQNVGNIWDSGKVVGDQTVNVEYAGKSLNSRELC